MDIRNSAVLVTGASRGIGAEFVKQLHARGAAKIYATAPNTEAIAADDNVVPLTLDVRNKDQIAAAASWASDVQIVIIEAGASERVVDDISRAVKAALTSDPSRYRTILGG